MAHGGFGLIFGLPEAPTAIFVVCLVIVLGYFLLNSYSKTLREEIDGLRKAMAKQAERHQRAVADLNTKLDGITARYDLERSDKHKARNDVARAVTALDLVRRLAETCTCGALAPLIEIVDRMVEEFESMTHRRHDDPPPEGATP